MAEDFSSTPFRFFLDKDRRMNWRNVDNADINQILKVKITQGDLRPLNILLEDLAFVDYYKDDFIQTNPEVYKMMRINQAGLQYFLFFQSQLKNWCKSAHEAAEHEETQNKVLKEAVRKQKSKIRKLKREIENVDMRGAVFEELALLNKVQK